MVMEDHDCRTTARSRAANIKFAVLTLSAFALVSGAAYLRTPESAPPPEQAATDGEPSQALVPIPANLFVNWKKPDIALLFSGQVHGYLKPCGCSEPQKGGFARRYNFIEAVKARGWPVLQVDLGDLIQKGGPEALIKYRYSMESMKLLRIGATGIGENELVQPLIATLAEYALNERKPSVLATNLTVKSFADQKPPVFGREMIAGGPKHGLPFVGIASIVAPSVAKANNDPNDVSIETVEKQLDKLLRTSIAELQQGIKKQQADNNLPLDTPLLVLLYQGSVEEAKACAKKNPEFQVILCLCKEEEPPARPVIVGETMIVEVGHKGRSVGVLGALLTGKTDNPFDFGQYELVPLGPEFETPQGKEAQNPIHDVLQRFAEEIKRDDYLARFPQTRHVVQVTFPEATYVGSQKCKSCHKHAYKIWDDSPHPHAYDDLANKATRPTLRQFDGECVVCHVTGFQYLTGYRNEQKTPHLRGVGCESCHGPGSEHIKDKNNAALHSLMNPWHPAKEDETELDKTRRMNLVDQFCQKCHDTDNDVNWDFAKKYPRIIHLNPNGGKKGE